MASHSSGGICQANSGSPPPRNASYSISPIRSPPGPSGSAISTTRGRSPGGSVSSAARITGANSVSVSTTLASPWRRMNAISSASSRVLSALSTAPTMGTPKCASTRAGMLGAMTATVSPRPTPQAAQRRGEAAAAGISLRPARAVGAMHHGDPVRIDLGRPLDERERRERHVVRRPLRHLVVRLRHRCLPQDLGRSYPYPRGGPNTCSGPGNRLARTSAA